MQLLQWKPSYSLGILAVDSEHRALIASINGVYEQLENEHDAEQVEAVLGDIHAQIASHFALEETLMRAANFVEYKDHKDSHEELLDQIRDLMDTFAADPETGKVELQKRLADWFGVHFATFDARLHLKLPH